jgi:hypothetical protein
MPGGELARARSATLLGALKANIVKIMWQQASRFSSVM